MTNKGICRIEGCGKNAHTRGWCRPHYARNLKHGNPLAGKAPDGVAAAYLKEVVLAHKDAIDCLVWPFGKDGAGYGRIWHKGRAENVCRLVCEGVHGSPPDGFYAAHSCGMGHIGCVNPNHLRWASPKENSRERFYHKAHKRGRFAETPSSDKGCLIQ